MANLVTGFQVQGQAAQVLLLLARLHLDCRCPSDALQYADAALQLAEALSLELLVSTLSCRILLSLSNSEPYILEAAASTSVTLWKVL